MSYTTIIQTNDLADHLHDPDWVIVDCRFELLKPAAGFEQYQQGHIPGAVYADLDKDLAGPKTEKTGRHPLPDMDAFIQTASNWGIEAGKQVVAYDAVGGSFAVRLWWMLRFMGHESVAVLDGGLPKWEREGRGLTSGVEHNPPAHFTGIPRPEMLATDEDVDRIRQNPEFCLIDARTPERYRGETEPIDPVAGHIPGAINRFHGQNMDANGVFKPVEQLRAEFEGLIGDTDPQNVVIYCGSGVTSIYHLLAMEMAGLPGGKVYIGSWSQWIRDPNHPIARGEESRSE